MQRALSVTLVFLAACSSIGLGDPGSGASDAAAEAPPAATNNESMPQGISCQDDSSTGTTLCAGLSTCPGVTVDPDQFPNCGFRVIGQAIDLECSCTGSLCSMGGSPTCDDAKTLLANKTLVDVCSQVSQGLCKSSGASASPAATGATGTGGGASSTTTQSSTCDRSCADDCGGAPTCLVACGC